MWKTGFLRELRRIYPNANIKLVMYPAAKNIVENCPYVDEIILNPIDFNLADFVGMFKHNIEISKKLLTEKTDICFAPAYYHHTQLLMYMCGAAERICYEFDEDDTINWPDNSASPHFLHMFFKRSHLNFLATVKVPQFLYGGHNFDISLAPLDYILKMPVLKRNMEIWLNAKDKSLAKNILADKTKKYFALSMGGNTLFKHYPSENYGKVLEMILKKEKDVIFVIFGGGENDLKSAEILKNSFPKIYEENIIDLTSKLTLRESAAVLSLCEIFIGNDTGLMHIASALKIPSIVVFCTPTDLPEHRIDCTKTCCPHQVPNVVIQPKKSLPECAAIKVSHFYGCKAPLPHCITQIKPETIFKAYDILRERIEKNILETLYLK